MPDIDISGFVLAGGKSTRMGRDKAAISLDGRTLLEHALGTLRQVCNDVRILGSPHLYGSCGAEVVEDIFPGCGPLGGIHAALSHTRTRFNLIIAVDTPFLSVEFLRFMMDHAVASAAVVTTPEIAGYRQPLCSVYSRNFLPIAEKALRSEPSHKEASAREGKSADYKIVPLFPADGTCVISEAEIRKFAFTTEMFDNLNTPDDLKRAQRRGLDFSHE